MDAILDSRKIGRRCALEYLVRWKGYSPLHDSWEPTANISVPQLIKEFYQKKPTAVRMVFIEGKDEERTAPMILPSNSSDSSSNDFSRYANAGSF